MSERNILSNIKAERVRKDFTQEDMAEKLKIDKATYNRKEKGKSKFTLEEFQIILTELDCDPRQLL